MIAQGAVNFAVINVVTAALPAKRWMGAVAALRGRDNYNGDGAAAKWSLFFRYLQSEAERLARAVGDRIEVVAG